jgi:hypothetical protein
VGLAACGDDEGSAPETTPPTPQTARLPCGDERVKLDPADFVRGVDNPYFPLKKGATWSYRGSDKEGTKSTSEVTVPGRTKQIAGITATGIVDRGSEDGKLLEVATEWYAQDKNGNVWYLGEDVDDREVGEKTSSLYGDGPLQAGVTMMGKPIPGSCHRLSYEKGESADRFAVLNNRARVTVPAGRYTNVVLLKQTTPLEKDLVEDRYYARGVGLVLVKARSGEKERVELVKFTPGE